MDELLRTHYHQQHLSPTIQARLIAMVRAHAAQHRHYVRLRRGAMVAAAIVSAVCLWLLLTHGGDRTQAAAIAEAVAAHHRLAKPMTIQTDDPDRLSREVGPVSFMLRLPTDPHFPSVTLLGGRRCTLGGAPAVHVRLQAQDGQEHSLFIADRRHIRLATERIPCHDTDVVVHLWTDPVATYAWVVPHSSTRHWSEIP